MARRRNAKRKPAVGTPERAAEMAESWYERGQAMLPSEKRIRAGMDEMQGEHAIKALVYLAYAEGMMEGHYGHPSNYPPGIPVDWGDFLFDTGIQGEYAEAIALGQARGKNGDDR